MVSLQLTVLGGTIDLTVIVSHWVSSESVNPRRSTQQRTGLDDCVPMFDHDVNG